MPKVLTICPITKQTIEMHAVMSCELFKRLSSPLAVYCDSCRQPHLVPPAALWMGAGIKRSAPDAPAQTIEAQPSPSSHPLDGAARAVPAPKSKFR
jgi:hypothetical protein